MTNSPSNSSSDNRENSARSSKKINSGHMSHFYQNGKLSTQVGTQGFRSVQWVNSAALVQHEQSGEVKILLIDQVSTVVGAATRAMAYSPYGYIPFRNIESLVAFNGQWRDPMTLADPLGAGHRSYHPDLYRFASPDTLSPFENGGLNPYAYCEGDPINHIDPSGQAKIPWSIKKPFSSPTRLARHYEKQRSDLIAKGNQLLSRTLTGKKYSPDIDYQKSDLLERNIGTRYNNSLKKYKNIETDLYINGKKIENLKQTSAKNDLNPELIEAYWAIPEYYDSLIELRQLERAKRGSFDVWDTSNLSKNVRNRKPDPRRFEYRS